MRITREHLRIWRKYTSGPYVSMIFDLINELLAFTEDCYENFDCDSDAHKYNTRCRACEAKALLLENK